MVKNCLFFEDFGKISFLNRTLGLRKIFLKSNNLCTKILIVEQSFLNRDSFSNRSFLNRDLFQVSHKLINVEVLIRHVAGKFFSKRIRKTPCLLETSEYL
jgi:hypothetical protein